jgi:hypothetical protein
MKKYLPLLLACLMLFALTLPLLAEDDEKEEAKAMMQEEAMTKDLSEFEKLVREDIAAKSCFISKDSAGTEWVFLRLQPSQYNLIRLKNKIRKTSARIMLRPRQRYALKMVTGSSAVAPKIIVIVNERSIYRSSTLNAHYIYRRLSAFKPIIAAAGEQAESAEPAGAPSAVYF